MSTEEEPKEEQDSEGLKEELDFDPLKKLFVLNLVMAILSVLGSIYAFQRINTGPSHHGADRHLASHSSEEEHEEHAQAPSSQHGKENGVSNNIDFDQILLNVHNPGRGKAFLNTSIQVKADHEFMKVSYAEDWQRRLVNARFTQIISSVIDEHSVHSLQSKLGLAQIKSQILEALNQSLQEDEGKITAVYFKQLYLNIQNNDL